MNVEKVDMSNPIAQKIHELKLENGLSIFAGKYGDAIKAQKQLAKIGIDNFELVTKVESPIKGTVPVFSKYGFRMILSMLIDKFRIKTPEEKKLEKCVRFLRRGF